jgi:elongation factor P
MDLKTYEQIPLGENQVQQSKGFLVENMEVSITFYKDSPISIELPVAIEAKVIKTEPGVKGDTVSNNFKPSEIETGAKIQVPLFINEGDLIKIDTRTGEYITRASK